MFSFSVLRRVANATMPLATDSIGRVSSTPMFYTGRLMPLRARRAISCMLS